MPHLISDRYRLLSRFPGGGAWRGYDELLKRDVVVEELPDRRRAAVAARLAHPGLVRVHDLLEEGGKVWLVLEFLPGLTLAETVRLAGPLRVEESAALGRMLAVTLAYIHGLGLVHGAVCPETVSLTGERVALFPVGLAAPTDGFVAPHVATAAADVWSLGATLYFVVEGRMPFADGRGPRPTRRAGALEPVLRRMLRTDPDRRPTAAHAAQLLAAAGGFHGRAPSWPARRTSTTAGLPTPA